MVPIVVTVPGVAESKRINEVPSLASEYTIAACAWEAMTQTVTALALSSRKAESAMDDSGVKG